MKDAIILLEDKGEFVLAKELGDVVGDAWGETVKMMEEALREVDSIIKNRIKRSKLGVASYTAKGLTRRFTGTFDGERFSGTITPLDGAKGRMGWVRTSVMFPEVSFKEKKKREKFEGSWYKLLRKFMEQEGIQEFNIDKKDFLFQLPSFAGKVGELEPETGIKKKSLPPEVKKVLNKYKPEIRKKGWVQIRFGKEFIEKSYIVSKKPEFADQRLANRKGYPEDYEMASSIPYYDPEKKLFWRFTGSFD